MSDTAFFDDFAASLAGPDRIERLRAGLIGEGVQIDGPFGQNPLIYADYVASGRALRQIELLILDRVLPFYANSHTEGSHCGAFVTNLRRQARQVIARHCGADQRHATLFVGSGATAGLNRLVSLLGLPEAAARGDRPLVLIGPYEHHSNILPWRESGAEVVEIDESATGGPDLARLEAALIAGQGRPLVGAFSAASNITGIVTPIEPVSRLLKTYGALSIWDFAGGGPYLHIDMAAGTDHEIDAAILSPHKFIGGPGASGVMVLRRAAVVRDRPVWPGGGTVAFVSPWGHAYLPSLEDREEAGTPNMLGDLRAALAIIVKEAIGQDFMDRRHGDLRDRALRAWASVPGLRVMGNPKAAQVLPFFSLSLGDDLERPVVHHQVMTRILSDCFGIQARGGCACAGPYGHRLMGIDRAHSDAIRARVLAGDARDKPGFTRLNLSALMTDAKADRIIDAVTQIARDPDRFARLYHYDAATADFKRAS